MPYFIRVSDYNHIEADIERGFSSYMGDFDLEDVAMHMGIDTIYNDNWEEEVLDEIVDHEWADDGDWVQIDDNLYRMKHHDGLACHLIGNCLSESAIRNALQNEELGFGNKHEAMWGNIQWIASINEITHVFYADEYCEV